MSGDPEVERLAWNLSKLGLSGGADERKHSGSPKVPPNPVPVSMESISMTAAISHAARNRLMNSERKKGHVKDDRSSLASIMGQLGPQSAVASAVEHSETALVFAPASLTRTAEKFVKQSSVPFPRNTTKETSRDSDCPVTPSPVPRLLSSSYPRPSAVPSTSIPSDLPTSSSLTNSFDAMVTATLKKQPTKVSADAPDRKHSIRPSHHVDSSASAATTRVSNTGQLLPPTTTVSNPGLLPISNPGQLLPSTTKVSNPGLLPVSNPGLLPVSNPGLPTLLPPTVEHPHPSPSTIVVTEAKSDSVSPWLKWWIQLQQLKPDPVAIAGLRKQVYQLAKKKTAEQARQDLFQSMVLDYDQIFFRGVLSKMIQMRRLKLHLTSNPSIRDVLGMFRARPPQNSVEFEIQIGGEHVFIATQDFKDPNVEVKDCVGHVIRNNLELLQSIIEHMIIHFLERACESHSDPDGDDRNHSPAFKRASRAIFAHPHTSSHRASIHRLRPPSDPALSSTRQTSSSRQRPSNGVISASSQHSMVVGMDVVFLDTQVPGDKPQKGVIAKLNKKTLQVRLSNNTFWMGKYEHFKRVK